MVVVYSGENAEGANWDAGVPSERPTYTNLAPAPREREEGEPAEPGAPRSATAADPARPETPPQAPAARLSGGVAAPKKRRLPLIIFSSLALSLIGLALVPPSRPEPSPEARPIARAQVAPEALPTNPAHAESPPPKRVEPPQARPSETAQAAPDEPSPTAEPEHHRHVTVELSPPDAKLLRRGARQPGPPYVIEVPPGKRLTFEVTRKGYVKHKLVLDGKDARVSVNLEKQTRKAASAKK